MFKGDDKSTGFTGLEGICAGADGVGPFTQHYLVQHIVKFELQVESLDGPRIELLTRAGMRELLVPRTPDLP